MKKTPKKGDSAQRAFQVVQEATDGAPVTPHIEALRINEVLLSRGLPQVQANAWWNVPNSHLDGKTPNQVWLSAETPSPETIVRVRLAAQSAQP